MPIQTQKVISPYKQICCKLFEIITFCALHNIKTAQISGHTDANNNSIIPQITKIHCTWLGVADDLWDALL